MREQYGSSVGIEIFPAADAPEGQHVMAHKGVRTFQLADLAGEHARLLVVFGAAGLVAALPGSVALRSEIGDARPHLGGEDGISH